MLSTDELTNGMPFILKLWDAAGAPSYWVQTLRQATALHWYDIYRRSDWAALLSEGRDVFEHRVTEEEAQRVRTSSRCVFIQTSAVTSNWTRRDPPRPALTSLRTGRRVRIARERFRRSRRLA